MCHGGNKVERCHKMDSNRTSETDLEKIDLALELVGRADNTNDLERAKDAKTEQSSGFKRV